MKTFQFSWLRPRLLHFPWADITCCLDCSNNIIKLDIELLQKEVDPWFHDMSGVHFQSSKLFWQVAKSIGLNYDVGVIVLCSCCSEVLQDGVCSKKQYEYAITFKVVGGLDKRFSHVNHCTQLHDKLFSVLFIC